MCGVMNAKTPGGPWLCHLTDMLTPDRKFSVDGLPNMGIQSEVCYLFIYIQPVHPWCSQKQGMAK